MQYIVDFAHNINVTLINRGTKFAETPLAYAMQNRDKAMIDLLLQKGADVNSIASKNRSVMHFLLEGDGKGDNIEDKEFVDILNLMISEGAPLDIRDSNERTLLHYAAKNKQKVAFMILLPHLERYLNCRDQWGSHALHLLLEVIKNEDGLEENNYIDLVKAMLQVEPMLITWSDKLGRTVFHFAALNKQREIMKVLLSYYNV